MKKVAKSVCFDTLYEAYKDDENNIFYYEDGELKDMYLFGKFYHIDSMHNIEVVE